MKHISTVFFLLAACLCSFSGTHGAIDAGEDKEIARKGGMYFGGGFNYYAEHFRGSLGGILHNTRGFNVRGGYCFSEYFSLEALFQYYDEFRHRKDVTRPEWWHLVTDGDNLPESEYLETVTVSGYDITVNAKGHIPLGYVRPYGLIGLGFGRSKLKVKEEEYSEPSASYSGTENWTGCLGRAGAGCDLRIIGGLGMNVEIAYNSGFGDLETLRFISATAGVFYAF
jgi:opacity protein-like surface antigen